MAQKLVVDDAIAKSFLDLDCKTIISSKDDAQKLLDLGIAESQKPVTQNKPEKTSDKKPVTQNKPEKTPVKPHNNNNKKQQSEKTPTKQESPKQKPKSSNGSAKRKRKKQRQKQETATPVSVQNTPTSVQNKPVDKVAIDKKNKKEKKNKKIKEKKTKKPFKINLSFLKFIPAIFSKIFELLGNRITLGIGLILFVVFAILSIL